LRAAIIGAGDVGLKLAEGLTEIGYEVAIGSRNPSQEKLVTWVKNHKNSSVASPPEAAKFGDIIVVSTPWSGTLEAIKLAGISNFEGKVVIDVTNPLDFSQGAPRLALGYSDSAGETVQRLLPSAKVVKSFNTIGNPHMVHPQFPCGPPTMFICGNDQGAKDIVRGIVEKFGWEAIDIGGIEEARLLESLAMLWIRYYMRSGNGDHAFKLLKK
jgi:predicted dinucleotide-binding enzyme